MYARIVRFTDVTPERIEALQQRIADAGGPPEGVVSDGIRVYVDGEQGTAVAVQLFGSEEDMRKSAEVLDSMPADDTPGKRVSVDFCELKAEADA